MGRKKIKFVEPYTKISKTCYVCGKEIKKSTNCILIGNNKFRHKKCKPGMPSFKLRKKWVKNPGSIVHNSKIKKSRQEQKIQLKKEL